MLAVMAKNATRASCRWLLALLALPHVSCDVQCGAECEDSATVSFEPPLREPGDYQIRYAPSPGGTRTCTLTIPSSGAPEHNCDTLYEVWADGHFVEVRSFFVPYAPSRIDVLVEKDGDVLADESLTPVYREESTCGTDCVWSNTSLVLRSDA